MKNETDIVYMNKELFANFKKILKRASDNIFNCEKEEYAFTVSFEDGKNVIVINSNSGLNKNELQVVIEHEKAHAAGIVDEEIADIRALSYLSLPQKEILISNWKDRHGHEFTW